MAHHARKEAAIAEQRNRSPRRMLGSILPYLTARQRNHVAVKADVASPA
jgi:hypothetical protein